jgi:release factor glutamine methyltransferase
MNAVVKYVVGHTYKPWLEKYLSRKRIYHHNGFRLEIPPEVFHPGFFFSTKFLMNYLDRYELKNKSLLELGAGSGLISFHAAKKGASVTASDLNQTAIEYLNINSRANDVEVKIIHSDLFKELPEKKFDFIVLNPPYYKKDALTEKDLAWFCGSNGEYFQRLFAGIGAYMHEETEVMMVLCDGCDLEMISRMGKKEGYAINLLCSKKTLIERNFIFSIKKTNSNLSVYETERPKEVNFRNLYYAVRKMEERIYTDEQVRQLPSIDASHVHAKEWQTRRESSGRLISYLTSSKKKMNILEIGCGNGWLSHRLSKIPMSNVTGIDVNSEELAQAKRVFHDVKNLEFLEVAPGDLALRGRSFDIIVFAASIQYFEDLREILQWALNHLHADGSIHILDTYFYKEKEVQAAEERTRNYFSKLGFPRMAEYYFHHSFDCLKEFDYQILFDPRKMINKLFQRRSIFPWLMIEHN